MSAINTISELGRLDVPEEVVKHASERVAETLDVRDQEIYHTVAAETSPPQWIGRPTPLRPWAPKDASVYLANVFSYIEDRTNDGDKSSGRQALLTHPAGRHWGVYVEDRPSGSIYLYHLVFKNSDDANINSNPDSLTGKIREIILEARKVTKSIREEDRVGATHYTTGEVTVIGIYIKRVSIVSDI
jgi:hypothetical protein